MENFGYSFRDVAHFNSMRQMLRNFKMLYFISEILVHQSF